MAEKLPAIHLYPGDWLRDGISGCSLAAQGLWLRMMFVAHDAPKYGHIFATDLLEAKASIARRCGATVTEFESLFSELLAAGVPGIEDGFVVSRRMVRDAKLREIRAKAGRKGGKQTAKQSSSKRPSKRQANTQQNTEVEDEVETDIEDESKSGKGQKIDAVVSHYQSYHPRAKAGRQERAKISARIGEGFSVDDLKLAIDGCHVSKFHGGDNDRGAKYQTLELIVRDSSKVTQFIELAGNEGGPQLSERSRRSIAAIRQFTGDTNGIS
jgi:hypothetical protein